MAVDSQTKRRSALAATLAFLVVAPLADGTVAAVDREHIIGIYAGISPATPGVSTTAIHIFATSTVEPNHASDSGDNVLVAGDVEVQGASWIGGTSLLGGNVTIGIGAAGVDYTLTFDGEDADGVITWMEDEDRFDFADAVLVTGFHSAITTKTDTDYTATINDDVILVSTGATTRTISFPAASTLTGKIYHIKKIDSGVGLVTLDPNGSETIDGDLTPDITTQYESFMIVSDGSNWHVI